MAKTTTINTKTGERLKGVKATEKGINGLVYKYHQKHF